MNTSTNSSKVSAIEQDLFELPARIEKPSAWTGSAMRDNPGLWLYTLTPEDIADLENAAKRFLALGIDIGEITKDTFPVSVFSEHLCALRNKLLHGTGFEVIRGLPVENYSQQFAATIYCGLGAHLGSARSQNAQGHILGHVRDTGADAHDPESRIYQTNSRQTFHTDSTDVVGLLCLREAKQGGKSLLVSAESIYNRMNAERPDLVCELFNPVATDRRGEVPAGEMPYMTIPVLNWHEGFLTVFYQRQYINSSERFADAPTPSILHIEAMDMLDDLANDPLLYLDMQLQPGDMQFVYNHSQLHDRTGFVDWPEPGRRRHLMRLWLSLDGDRPLPGYFKQRYGSIEIGNRGGIVTENTRLHAPID